MSASLYDRMREAVDTLADAGSCYDRREPCKYQGHWNAANLVHFADKWEAEDKARAAREHMVDSVACNLFESGPLHRGRAWRGAGFSERDTYIRAAEALLDAFDVKPKGG